MHLVLNQKPSLLLPSAQIDAQRNWTELPSGMPRGDSCAPLVQLKVGHTHHTADKRHSTRTQALQQFVCQLGFLLRPDPEPVQNARASAEVKRQEKGVFFWTFSSQQRARVYLWGEIRWCQEGSLQWSPELVFQMQTLRKMLWATSSALKLVFAVHIINWMSKTKRLVLHKFMASFMFNFHGFSQIICAEGQVHPQDSFSCILQGKWWLKGKFKSNFQVPVAGVEHSVMAGLWPSASPAGNGSCCLSKNLQLWITAMVTKAGTYKFFWGKSCRFLVTILFSRKGKSQLRFWWQCCGLGTVRNMSESPLCHLGGLIVTHNFQLLQHQKLI